MAITVVDSPQALTPAYNPMYWYFDSTNKTEEGFRYIVEVVEDASSDVIGTYKLKPIPVSGYGEVDIRKLIQSTIFTDFQTLNSYKPNGHQTKYRVNVSEEYFVNVAFTDYLFAGSGSWTNFSDPSINPSGLSRTMLEHGATNPGFSAGDVINVAQADTPAFRNELEGIHTVLDVFLDTGVYYTVLDLTWIGSGAASAGVTTYADGLKSVFPSYTGTVQSGFKAAFTFLDFRSYSAGNFELDGSGKSLLTTLPETVRISRDMPTWLSGNVLSGSDLYVVFIINLTAYRYAIGSLTDIVNFNILPSDSLIEDVFSGGSWIPFAGGLDLTDVETYTVQVQQIVGAGLGTAKSRIRTVSLYNECDRFTTYDICFFDRYGSWITIPFNKGDYLTQTVNRQKIQTKYGTVTDDGWGYETTDKGNQTYDVNESISYRVSTGILSEIESQYMRELLSTPQAYVSIDGGNWQAIEILSTSQPLHKKRTQRDRKVSLEFRMAVQDEVNG
jgi:hypothetical protein